MRLLRLSIFSVIATFLALFILRSYGLKQGGKALEHPLLQSKIQVIFDTNRPDQLSPRMDDLVQAFALSPTMLIKVDVRLTGDKELILFNHDWLKIDGQLQRVTYLSTQEIERFSPILTLKEVLKYLSNAHFYLNIQSNAQNIDKMISAVIEAAGAGERVIIQSDYDVIVHSIKSLHPLWLYGTGQGERTRMSLLNSLFIETLTPLKGDIFILPKAAQEPSLIHTRMISEIHRREKKIFVGQVDTPQQVKELIEKNIDGFITKKPNMVLKLLSSDR